MSKIDDLPTWLNCGDDDCHMKHFLTFNRNSDGKWSGAYVEYTNYLAVCPINDADTLNELAIRLAASIKRNQINENPSNT